MTTAERDLLVETAMSALTGAREGFERVAEQYGPGYTVTLGEIVQLLTKAETETRALVAAKVAEALA